MRKTRPETIVAGDPNHLMLRGNNRRRLFSYPRDYQRFLGLMQRALDQFNCRLHATCLMVNHVHKLSTPPTVEAISRFVAQAAQRYAQIRNAQRESSGKLFEQRFRSKPVLSDEHLAYATMYIDANPVRAGIVDDPMDYPWSTYALHAGAPRHSKVSTNMWTPSDWYLGLGRTLELRARRYRELFETYLKTAPRDDDFEEPTPYSRRLRRPNDTRASEPVAVFGGKATNDEDLDR